MAEKKLCDDTGERRKNSLKISVTVSSDAP